MNPEAKKELILKSPKSRRKDSVNSAVGDNLGTLQRVQHLDNITVDGLSLGLNIQPDMVWPHMLVSFKHINSFQKGQHVSTKPNTTPLRLAGLFICSAHLFG